MSTFPLDWDKWRDEWTTWLGQNIQRMKLARSPFPGKNFLADEILGCWEIDGKLFELSEVVFPNLEDRDERGNLIRGDKRRIGITFREGDGENVVVGSFADLETAIGLG